MDRSAIMNDVSVALAKISPASAIMAATATGFSLQTGVSLAGGGLILMQVAHLWWKWRCEAEDRKARLALRDQAAVMT